MISILILKIVAALNGMVLELWFMMRQTGHLIICPVIPPYKGADNAHQPSHHLAAAPPTKKHLACIGVGLRLCRRSVQPFLLCTRYNV